VTVQLRVRSDARTSKPPARHRLDWERDPDLDRFADLSEHDRVRVIIRVLCGLVALEEAGLDADSPVPEPEEPVRRRRLLPFLGYESRARGDGLVAAGDAPERGLPYLGLDAPMGETAPAWVRMTA
jgi:hypothetical protein